MVDVSYSPSPDSSSKETHYLDDQIPEDNVERLRNIRDMFENSNDSEEQVILQRVEKVQPSEKLLERLTNNDNNLHVFEFDNLIQNQQREEINNMNNNINSNTDQSDDSSSANEDFDQVKSDDYYVKKLNPQIALNTQCILDKIDMSQVERSINGGSDETQNNNNNNELLLNGLDSSKTTSSVSSSTSISSNVETGERDIIIIEQTNNENESSSLSPSSPVIIIDTNMHANSPTNDLSVGSVQIDCFELDENSNENDTTTNNNNNTNRFLEATNDHEEEEYINPGELQQSTSFRFKQKDIITIGDIRSVDMRSVKTRFERFNHEDDDDEFNQQKPRPVRKITPPPEGANRIEIENQPMERPTGVVSAYDKLDKVVVQDGYIRSRKEMFKPEDGSKSTKPRGIKEITPPREDILKRVLKETTPERNENVIHASDRTADVLPSRGNAKQKASMILNDSNSRSKAIERSGIRIEGQLTEKGLAKSRAAIFSDPSTYNHAAGMTTTEIEAEYFKQNVSGVAKERLNIFKNLEQQQKEPNRTSPGREIRKLKEFTPPPQLDPAVAQQRQYIIVDRNQQQTVDLSKDYNKDEFFVESGLAKNRIKQYLDTSSQPQCANFDHGTGELKEKGVAKSLLAKWKSMEEVKDKETSPEPHNHVTVGRIRDRFNPEEMLRQRSPTDMDDNEEKENLIQAGNAKNLLSKWNNLDANPNERRGPRGPRQITPPPPDELRRNSMNDQDAVEAMSRKVKSVYTEEAGGLIGRGHARSTLAKLEQSYVDSTTKIRRTVTPPKEFINRVLSEQNYVYENTPVDSGINSQFAEHEDVIPSPGHAKNLKDRFINLEKEAQKVETSSSKMNYVPKKFTSSSPAAVTAAQASAENNETAPKRQPQSIKKITADKIAAVTAPTTPQINANKELNTNIYLSHHSSTLSADKCCVCEKTVYAMEKIEADKKVYHKLCFKCTSCNCTLNEDSADLVVDGLPYCAIHIKQFLSPTKSPKKAVVYDTVNNVIQVKEYEELKIDTSFKSIDLKQSGVKSPASNQPSPAGRPPISQQNSPTKQVSQQNSPTKQLVSPQPNSPAVKQVLSQPNSPAIRQQQQQQQNSPVARQQVSQPSSPTKQMPRQLQQQQSPGSNF